MTSGRPRVILDCNVLLQALFSPEGPGAVCVELARKRRIVLVLSRDVLSEARGILNRPEIRARRPSVTSERVEAFLEELRYTAVVVDEVPAGPEYGRDPNDQPYMDLAVAAGADYLVTRDQALLTLGSAHTPEAKAFRQRHHNRLKVRTPAEFLAEMSKQ